MKHTLLILVAAFSAIIPFAIHAQPASASDTKLDNAALEKLIEAVAKKTGKKLIVDPRVRAQVIVYGVGGTNMSYSELLAALAINNFAAIENGEFVYVLPAADARAMPVPTVSGTKKYDDNEFVTKVIPIKSMPATMLIPSLRPMLPQYAHLSAISCTNTLIVVDRYANVKRLQTVIDALDSGQPFKARDCTAEETKK